MTSPEGFFEMAPIKLPPAPVPTVPEGYVPEWTSSEHETFRIQFNQDQIDEVLGTLLEQYENGNFPYNLDSTRLPHDPRHMPEKFVRGDLDKSMFLWTVCYYMRGGIKSVEAVKRLTPLYNERPDLFDCDVAAETNPEEIAELLGKHGLGFQKTISNTWVTNAQRLRDRWDGDPRNIFNGVDTYEESLKRVANDGKGGGFKGFKEKMTSMIIYYLMDEGLIDEFPFPIPVDLHVLRVSIANKLISFPDEPLKTDLYTPQVTAALRQIYFDYAVKNQVSSLRLCDAVWLLSESICGKHPGNQTLEPLGRKHRNGRSTYLLPEVVNLNSAAQQSAYQASCQECPLDASCEYTLPGKPYYIAAALFIRGHRQRFELPAELDLF